MNGVLGQLLLFLVPLLPLALAPLFVAKKLTGGRKALFLLPLGALPALLASVLVPLGTAVDLPWLLLGGRLGLDATGRIFLLFISLLWLLAAVYAVGYLAEDPCRRRFFSLFLVAMAGNLGVLVAEDLPLFYLFFALMSFSSYVLVIHNGSREALRAGRVYLAMVVLGELCIFAGLLLAVEAGQTLRIAEAAIAIGTAASRETILLLLVVGFGIKAGLFPLHLWLPLAHPVAPTPASAVLSGAMIKTGLFALLRFLPLGLVALPGWGELLLAAGLFTIFFGVGAGVVQQEAKTVLAYSSISQMGFLIVGLGLGLGAPEAWPAVAAGIALYAMHHGLAKGALFLGVGVAPLAGLRGRGLLVTAALLLPALALAGAPFTSGALAKISLKPYLDLAPSFWPRWGTLLLSLAAVGTTALMGRFFWLLREQRRGGDPPDRAMLASWGALVAASLLLPWVGAATGEAIEKALAFGDFWSALWPVGVGAVLTGVAGYLLHVAGWNLNIPAGDLLVMLERLWQWLTPRLFRQGGVVGRAAREKREYPDPNLFLATAEKRLLGWPLVGTLFLLLIVLQALLLAFF